MLAAWTLMKSKLLLGVVGTGVFAIALAVQRQEVKRLDVQAGALRDQVAILRAEADARKVTANTMSTSELIHLREEHAELLRLRGEVARLRSVGDPTIPIRLQQAEARAIQAEAAVAQIKAMNEARDYSNKIVNAMKYMGLAAKMYSVDHKGTFPKTFDEMRTELSGDMDTDGNFKGGVSLHQFEFHPHERTISEEEPTMILFQEKSPRRLPDGTWQRIYCLADGSVQTKTLSQPDFSEFEREGKGAAANAPKKP